MKLASGTAPVPAYLRADVAIGLGTDGAASNNDMDMFEAMRVAALLHKHVSVDPRALSARTVLEMATIRAARALGKDKLIGSLEPRKHADIITVSVSGARQTPMYDPVSHLVYVIRGDDVQNTIVNGRILMRNRKVLTIDEAATLNEARGWIEKVRAATK
jgi:5-methylthioadenosine/S-adenosylhomocysteine deaminase